MTIGKNPLSPMRRRAVDRLLVQYLELPQRQQQQWLEQSAQRLPRLTAWLRRLTADSHTVTLLDESMRRLAGESIERMEFHARHLSPADRLGPWEVIAEVGAGGMGRVYRGRRADDAFEMEVAIKQIGQRRRGLAELLQRECHLLARLDHPSVTRLVDAGLDDQAGPFLVMEWIEGQDLSAWLAREKPDLQTRLDLFERIAEAVAHAHQRLIVHGDIKPNNIRIREDGSVKLMDFGVARLLESGEIDHPGPRALTPAFAAPEQRAGEDITPGSDVWSLGALLKWLLGMSSAETPAADTSHPELAAIASKACAKKQNHRYGNVSEIIADLRRYRQRLPLSIIPHTRRYRARKFVQRNPGVVAALGSTVLALTVGIVVSMGLYFQAEQAREEALRQQATAEARAVELEQVARFQEDQLSELNPYAMGKTLRNGLVDMRRSALQSGGFNENEILQEVDSLEANLAGVNFTDLALNALETGLFQQTLDAIDRQFQEQPLLRARLLQTLASTLQELGYFDLAEGPQHQALQLRQGHLGPDHPDTLSAMHKLGAVYWRLSRIEEAHALIEQALEKRKATLGPEHPDTLESISGMGTLLISTADSRGAEEFLTMALEAHRNVLGTVHEETLRAAHNLANHWLEQGDPNRAKPLLLETTEKARNSIGPHHDLTLHLLNLMGVLHTSLGQFDEAINFLSEAVYLREEVFGIEHPQTLRVRSNLANVLQEAGQFELAVEQHREILKARTRSLGEFHGDIWVSALNLGAALRGIERFEEGLHYLEKSKFVAHRVFGAHHIRVLISETQIAQLYLESGEIEKAEQTARQATAMAAEHIGMDSMRTGIAFSVHARTLKAQNNHEDALRQARIGHQVISETLGPDHFLTERTKEVIISIQAAHHGEKTGSIDQ